MVQNTSETEGATGDDRSGKGLGGFPGISPSVIFLIKRAVGME